MKSTIGLLTTVCLILVLIGCEAIIPKTLVHGNMVPQNPELVFKCSGKTIALAQFKGPPSSSGNFLQVTPTDLQTAITDGLKHSQLFSAVYQAGENKPDYTLYAKIIGRPHDGISTVTAGLIVQYQIISNDTRVKVFDKEINGTCKVSFGEEMGGMTRHRKATEGSVRDNVKKFLEAISTVPF
jgi:hypothetical protein